MRFAQGGTLIQHLVNIQLPSVINKVAMSQHNIIYQLQVNVQKRLKPMKNTPQISFLIATAIVIAFILTDDLPSPNHWAGVTFTSLYNLSLAVMASCIFYYYMNYLPKNKRNHKLAPLIYEILIDTRQSTMKCIDYARKNKHCTNTSEVLTIGHNIERIISNNSLKLRLLIPSDSHLNKIIETIEHEKKQLNIVSINNCPGILTYCNTITYAIENRIDEIKSDKEADCLSIQTLARYTTLKRNKAVGLLGKDYQELMGKHTHID